MAYRNGTYVAFNGCGTTNPTQSDIKYFNILKAWAENEDIDFNFSNSHEKTSPVKDSSDKNKTLIPRLRERFKNSKCMLFIITDNTKNCSDIVDFEIEQAEARDLPIILAYVGECAIRNTNSEHMDKLPVSLKIRINEKKVKTLFIPFNLEAIKKGINDFNVHNKDLKNSKYVYKNIESWETSKV